MIFELPKWTLVHVKLSDTEDRFYFATNQVTTANWRAKGEGSHNVFTGNGALLECVYTSVHSAHAACESATALHSLRRLDV